MFPSNFALQSPEILISLRAQIASCCVFRSPIVCLFIAYLETAYYVCTARTLGVVFTVYTAVYLDTPKLGACVLGRQTVFVRQTVSKMSKIWDVC